MQLRCINIALLLWRESQMRLIALGDTFKRINWQGCLNITRPFLIAPTIKDSEKFEVWPESSLSVIYGNDEPRQNLWIRELESEISRGFTDPRHPRSLFFISLGKESYPNKLFTRKSKWRRNEDKKNVIRTEEPSNRYFRSTETSFPLSPFDEIVGYNWHMPSAIISVSYRR